ncbi:MAG: hypothetical protein SOU88_02175 [Candidatus Treponema excrementipullorum]|nr:hypothetical protein [Candidatus Treponema excrementipullorum]
MRNLCLPIVGIVGFICFEILLTSCHTIFLPALRVESCYFTDNFVAVTFSEAVSKQSLESGFSLTENESVLKGRLQVSGKTCRFYPEEGIQKHKEYILRLTTTVETAQGLSLAEDFIYNYSTKEKTLVFKVNNFTPDEEEEIVIDVSVPLELQLKPDKLSVEFNSPVDRKSFENGFKISPDFSYVFEYQNNDTVVYIIPEKQLDPGHYAVKMEDISDVYGNVLHDFYSNFIVKRDLQPITFDLLQNGTKKLVENEVVSLSKKDSLVINFNKAVKLENLSSHIEFQPCINENDFPYAESYSETGNKIEITPNLKTKKTATIRFSEEIPWGNFNQRENCFESGRDDNVVAKDGDKDAVCIWQLKVKAGIEDFTGNQTTKDMVYYICFNQESEKPPFFLGGAITGKAGEFDCLTFSPYHQFSTISFDPAVFPTSMGNNIKECFLNLFFAVNKEASTIDFYSLIKSVYVDSTDSCCHLYIKNVSHIDSGETASCAYLEYIKPEEDISDLHIVNVVFGLEIENKNKSGLMFFEILSSVQDDLGNNLNTDYVCKVNKQ